MNDTPNSRLDAHPRLATTIMIFNVLGWIAGLIVIAAVMLLLITHIEWLIVIIAVAGISQGLIQLKLRRLYSRRRFSVGEVRNTP